MTKPAVLFLVGAFAMLVTVDVDADTILLKKSMTGVSQDAIIKPLSSWSSETSSLNSINIVSQDPIIRPVSSETSETSSLNSINVVSLNPIQRIAITRQVKIPFVEQSTLGPGGGLVDPGIPGFTINDPYGNPLVTPGGGLAPGYVDENWAGVPGWGPGPFDKEGLFSDIGFGSEDSGLPPGASGVAGGPPGPGGGWTYVGDRWPRENDPFSKADECRAVREAVFVDIEGNESHVIELDCVGPLDIKESDGSSSLRAAREQWEEETKKKTDGLDSDGGWWERQFTPDQTSEIHKAKMDQLLEDILTGRPTEEDRTDQPWESRRVNKEGGFAPGKDADVDTDDTGYTRRYIVHLVGMGFSAEKAEAIAYWISRGAPIDPVE